MFKEIVGVELKNRMLKGNRLFLISFLMFNSFTIVFLIGGVLLYYYFLFSANPFFAYFFGSLLIIMGLSLFIISFFLPKVYTKAHGVIYSFYEEKQIDKLREIVRQEISRWDSYGIPLKTYAINALGDLKAKEAIPDLAMILSTFGYESMWVRHAARALAKIGTVDAVYALQEGKERASFLLKQLKKPAESFESKPTSFFVLYCTLKSISRYIKKLVKANGFSSEKDLFFYLNVNKLQEPSYLSDSSSQRISEGLTPVEPKKIPLKRKELAPKVKYGDDLTFPCTNCGETIKAILEKCPKCNEVILCSICKLAIREIDTLYKCPYCGCIGHSEHFLKWLTTNNKCPKCLLKLESNNLISLNLRRKEM